MRNEQKIIDNLHASVKSLSNLSMQLDAMYDVIRQTKDADTRQSLLYMYKQVRGSMGRHIVSIDNLVKVVKDGSDKK